MQDIIHQVKAYALKSGANCKLLPELLSENFLAYLHLNNDFGSDLHYQNAVKKLSQKRHLHCKNFTTTELYEARFSFQQKCFLVRRTDMPYWCAAQFSELVAFRTITAKACHLTAALLLISTADARFSKKLSVAQGCKLLFCTNKGICTEKSRHEFQKR